MNFGDAALPASFWERVVPEPNSGCWLWLGALSSRGRSRYSPTGGGGATDFAYRVAYAAARGAVPKFHMVSIACRTSCCVNPQHMVTRTIADINRAKAHKGAACKKGHSFTPDNTRVNYGGDRHCLECEKSRRTGNEARARLAAASRRLNLWRKFGLTVDAYNAMLAEQGGVCRICEGGFGGKTPHVDHDHATGAVRGIVCEHCNRGLGAFRDNIESLRNAIAYLERSRQPPDHGDEDRTP